MLIPVAPAGLERGDAPYFQDSEFGGNYRQLNGRFLPGCPLYKFVRIILVALLTAPQVFYLRSRNCASRGMVEAAIG